MVNDELSEGEFYYSSGPPLHKRRVEKRNIGEAIPASKKRMDYANKLRPVIVEAIKETGGGNALGWVETTGSVVSGAATNSSDIDFVVVKKQGLSWKDSLTIDPAKVREVVREKLKGETEYPFHIHLETFEEHEKKEVRN